MTKERKALCNRLAWFSVWVLIIVILFPVGIFAKVKKVNDNLVNTTKIQFLLSLYGPKSVDIDGICGGKTIDAIAEYKSHLSEELRKTFDVSCSYKTLDVIRKDARLNLGGQQMVDKNKNSTEIDNINARITNTNDSIYKLSGIISRQFDEQFRNLATIGIAALITSLSIIIAGVAFLGSMMLKDQVKDAHDKEVVRSKEKLESMLTIAHPQLSSSIYTSLSSFFTHLYSNLDPIRYEYLYKPNVLAALELARKGYDKANTMHKLILNDKTNNQLDDKQQSVVNMSLNNYTYFLADATTLKGEEAENAKNELRLLLPKLEMALKIRIADQQNKPEATGDYEIKEMHLLRETILWVKLHLGKKLFNDFDVTLDELKTSPLYTASQKKIVTAKYDKHKEYFPHLW